LTTTIGQLSEVRTQKVAQMSYETRQSKYSFALAHTEVKTKSYVYFHKPSYTTSHAVCKKRLHKRSSIQARGLHVARHSVLSGPRKHSEKIFRFEICCKACEVIFVSMNCLRWIKCICTRTMDNTSSVYQHCFSFTIKSEGTVLA